jgi:hypothetical protein
MPVYSRARWLAIASVLAMPAASAAQSTSTRPVGISPARAALVVASKPIFLVRGGSSGETLVTVSRVADMSSEVASGFAEAAGGQTNDLRWTPERSDWTSSLEPWQPGTYYWQVQTEFPCEEGEACRSEIYRFDLRAPLHARLYLLHPRIDSRGRVALTVDCGQPCRAVARLDAGRPAHRSTFYVAGTRKTWLVQLSATTVRRLRTQGGIGVVAAVIVTTDDGRSTRLRRTLRVLPRKRPAAPKPRRPQTPLQRAETAVEKAVQGKHYNGYTVSTAGATCHLLEGSRYTCTWNGFDVAAGGFCDGEARATVYPSAVEVILRQGHCG